MDENLVCFEVQTIYKSNLTRTQIITAADEKSMWEYYDKHHNRKLVATAQINDAWPA